MSSGGTTPGGGTPQGPPSINEYLYSGGYPFIDQYQLNTTTGIPTTPVQMNIKGVESMVATNPAKFLYVAQWSNSNASGLAFNVFSIKSDGTLALVDGSPFVAPFAPLSGAMATSLAITPDNSAIYFAEVPDGPNVTIAGFRADTTTGKLTQLSTSISFGINYGNGSGVGELAVDPSGQNLYAAIVQTSALDGKGHPQAGIAAFSIDPKSKELTQIAGSPYLLPSFSYPESVVIDPTGHFVYVAVTTTNQIQGYARNATTGALTPLAGGPFSAGPFLSAVAMHPSGKFLFALNDSEIDTLALDSNTGAMTITSWWSGHSVAPAFVVDPTGYYIYSATEGGGIFLFQIDQTTGWIKLVSNNIPAPNGDALASSITLVKAP
jgi:6-phosphogluconolactonase (cycloisomerase 2 family)